MVWQLLAKPLLGVVADGVKSFAETKKAKAELAVTTIKAQQKLKEDQIAESAKQFLLTLDCPHRDLAA